jgi:hypothetical protein
LLRWRVADAAELCGRPSRELLHVAVVLVLHVVLLLRWREDDAAAAAPRLELLHVAVVLVLHVTGTRGSAARPRGDAWPARPGWGVAGGSGLRLRRGLGATVPAPSPAALGLLREQREEFVGENRSQRG